MPRALHFERARIANRPKQRAEAESRLRQARNVTRQIRLRLQPYVALGKGTQWSCLVGEAVYATVAEAVDVWELIADTKRFWRAWRAMRLRPQGAQQLARQALADWDRAAAQGSGVEPAGQPVGGTGIRSL